MTQRLPAPNPEARSSATADLLDLAAARTGSPPPTIEVLAHAPDLLGPFLGWAAALALQSRLGRRHHEILALRISHLCGSAFEWDEHTGFAHEAGLSDDEIETIRAYPRQVFAADVENALLEAADQLHAAATVDDSTYERLARHLAPDQLVEVPFVVGQYAMLSMLTGFTGIAGPDDAVDRAT